MTESVAIISKSGEFLESADVVLPIYSITKSYIAACVFAAGIDINESISSWFDDRLVSRSDEISVRQLLNHTSGIRDYGALPSYHEAIQSGRVWTDDDFVEITLRNGLLFDPGSQWSYSNPGYWLLSKIIQNQCNLSFTGCVLCSAESEGLATSRLLSIVNLGGHPPVV